MVMVPLILCLSQYKAPIARYEIPDEDEDFLAIRVGSSFFPSLL